LAESRNRLRPADGRTALTNPFAVIPAVQDPYPFRITALAAPGHAQFFQMEN